MAPTVFGLQVDSVSPVPFAPALRALYLNGKFAERPVSFGRGRVWIDVLGTGYMDAHWADVSAADGDIPIAAFPQWNHAKQQAIGQWGGAYCNRSDLPHLVDAVGSQPCDLWLATLDGTTDPPELAQLPPNIRPVAVQAYPAGYLGINADLSVIIDQAYWEGRHA